VKATNKYRNIDHKEMNTMNRRTMLTLTALAFLCLGIALPPSDAFGQQKTLKELIVGTWILESVYDQTEDGIKHEPWGPGVKGIAMFDNNGHFSWQIMDSNKGDKVPPMQLGLPPRLQQKRLLPAPTGWCGSLVARQPSNQVALPLSGILPKRTCDAQEKLPKRIDHTIRAMVRPNNRQGNCLFARIPVPLPA
jgi:hypothetical protein